MIICNITTDGKKKKINSKSSSGVNLRTISKDPSKDITIIYTNSK